MTDAQTLKKSVGGEGRRGEEKPSKKKETKSKEWKREKGRRRGSEWNLTRGRIGTAKTCKYDFSRKETSFLFFLLNFTFLFFFFHSFYYILRVLLGNLKRFPPFSSFFSSGNMIPFQVYFVKKNYDWRKKKTEKWWRNGAVEITA